MPDIPIVRNCGGCFYYANGNCRHSPPIVIPSVNVQLHGGPNNIYTSGMTVWPTVGTGEWCGEWVPK